MLGLLPGRCCVGIAYEVAEADEAEVRRYLEARETAEEGYVEATVDILTLRGWDRGLCYVADGSHPRVSELPDDRLLHVLSSAQGSAGSNADYARRTISAVRSLACPSAWPSPCPGIGEKAAGVLCGGEGDSVP